MTITRAVCALAGMTSLLVPAIALASPSAPEAPGGSLPLVAVLPFAGLLLCIALFPLVLPHWWEKNRVKAIVSLAFGLPVAIYIGLRDATPVVHELQEYTSFIVLLGSLYVISGGLVLRGDIQATPAVNTLFLLVGALLANVVGTTGASMLLIRSVLRTNSERQLVRHIPVFFIFLVSNIGGALTPLGDPPLFLGYLRGVPFFWTLRLAPIWATALGLTLLVFYVWDRKAYALEPLANVERDAASRVPLSLAGSQNLLLLAGVIASVFLQGPWRELGMVSMAALSIVLTPRELRKENGFTFGPIVEVAVLFLGIFLTMIPALAILQARGAGLGLRLPWQFFWATGTLSSFLDNAPTYLTFAALAQGLRLAPEVIGVPHRMLMAISAGAVFMGANSYIGNGPNFMVKAIADEAKVKTPSFFGYMAVSAVVLLPIFLIITLLFFI